MRTLSLHEVELVSGAALTNEALGRGMLIGTGVGTVAGAAIGGPVGAIGGAAVGWVAGTVIGGLVDTLGSIF